MKFSKFFTDFTTGYTDRDKEDRDAVMSKHFIQFVKLKKLIEMIAHNNNKVDPDELTEAEQELAKSMDDDATLLFAHFLECQIKDADREYCSRMASLPRRLQIAFKMSVIRNVPDGETTYHDGALFSVNSMRSDDPHAHVIAETHGEKLVAQLPLRRERVVVSL